MSTQTKSNVKSAKITAMKSGDKSRSEALTAILAVIKQYEVDNRDTNAEATDIILYPKMQKMISQREDSIAQFTKGNREDLIEKEKYEIAIIEEFMPEAPPKPVQFTESELDEVVKNVIKEVGATSPKDMKIVMPIVKEKVEGKADMSIVSKKVKEFLTAL